MVLRAVIRKSKIELQELVRVPYLTGVRVSAAGLLATCFMAGVIRRPAEATTGQTPVGVTPKS
jgi:hypothetical protein